VETATATVDERPPARRREADAAGDAVVGTSIGRYRVIARVGAGAMGVVYRAIDPALDRTVALKLLPPLDEARRTHLEERLRREAQALARLDHENVVAVYDVGFAEQSLFVAMQFVDGTTLDEHLRAHPMRPRRALALFVAAGRGLAAAHAASIVHRDVKPGNLLIDRSGRVYVGDFGLARGAGAADADRPASGADLLGADLLGAGMTRTGAAIGTPLFMAPEQHLGEQATARSDQFSFCVSVWYELFGRHPFADGPWDHERALAAMEADRIAEPPRVAGLPARAVRALRRGLRRDPEARWPSLAALLAELEPRSRTGWVLGGLTAAGLAGGAIAAAAVGGVVSGSDPCAHADDELAEVVTPARTRALALGFAAVELPYAAATAARARAAVDAYAAEWSAARLDACRANRVRGRQSDELFDKRVACLDRRLAALDGVLGVLTQGPTADVVDRADAVVADLPPLAECADAAQLSPIEPRPADPAIRARIARAEKAIEGARARLDAGIVDGAAAAADRIVDDARALGWGPLVASALRQAAEARRWASDFEAAIARMREAAIAAGRARDDAAAAAAIIEVASLLAVRGQAPNALIAVDDAEVLVHRAGDPPHLRARLEAVRADALGHASRYAESDAAFDRAIASARAVPDRREVQIADLLVDRAQHLKDASERTRARDALLEARRIYLRDLGPDHPSVARIHQLLGGIYLELKDLGPAKAELERARAIFLARFPAGHATAARIQHLLGMVAIHEGRVDDAGQAFEDAHARFARAKPDDQETYDALYMLATVRIQQARYGDALALYQQVLDHRLRTLGDANVKTANVLDGISDAHHMRDEYARAVEARRRSLEIRERALGPNNPDVALSIQGLAYLALDHGDCAEAMRLSRRALAILERAKSPEHASINSVNVLAACEVKTGRLAEGRARFEQLLAMVDRPNAGTIDQRTAARYDFAEVLHAAGARARARKLVEEARAMFEAAGRTEDLAAMQQWLAKHPP
jgi:tetratricopeptide (TPR) repeat protein